MVNITRFNPIDDAFDELFRGFFVRPVSFDAGSASAQFRVDVAESNGVYKLHAEIPGVKKDDINISVNGDQVAISAEVKKEQDVKDGDRVLRSERYYGKIYRAFTLEHPVDETGVSARYADGVLEMTLPKKSVAEAKRITIQ